MFQSVYRHELETKLSQKPWKPKYQTGQEERRKKNFDYALDMIAWVHIFIASEFALTPTACYAVSANPQTETI
jgi:hypothetical protein